MNQNQNRDEIRAKDLWRAKNGMPQGNGNNRTPGGRKKPPRSLLVFGSILAGVLLLGILAENHRIFRTGSEQDGCGIHP